jgi:hypothetical protein
VRKRERRNYEAILACDEEAMRLKWNEGLRRGLSGEEEEVR